MALQSCRECGSQVSTEAATCPQCGVPNPTIVAPDELTSIADLDSTAATQQPGAFDEAGVEPTPEDMPTEGQPKMNQLFNGLMALLFLGAVVAGVAVWGSDETSNRSSPTNRPADSIAGSRPPAQTRVKVIVNSTSVVNLRSEALPSGTIVDRLSGGSIVWVDRSTSLRGDGWAKTYAQIDGVRKQGYVAARLLTTEPSYAVLSRQLQSNKTDAQRDAYDRSVRGIRVRRWSGRVSEVDHHEILGGYTVSVDMDPNDFGSEVSFDISDEEALSLNKGQRIQFDGTISRANRFLGTIQIRLVNAYIY